MRHASVLSIWASVIVCFLSLLEVKPSNLHVYSWPFSGECVATASGTNWQWDQELLEYADKAKNASRIASISCRQGKIQPCSVLCGGAREKKLHIWKGHGMWIYFKLLAARYSELWAYLAFLLWLNNTVRFFGTVSDIKPVISVVAGDYLQSLQASNGHENSLLRHCFSLTCMSDLPPNSASNRGTNHVLNNAFVSPLHHTEVIGNSQFCRSAVGNGSVSLSQLPDERNLNLQPDFNSSQACDSGTMTRNVLSGFGNEPDQSMVLYDPMSAFGNPNMLYKLPVSNASLKLELPSCQSAESADSAGTQRSSITNPSPLISSNNILPESESYGSNASNFLDALMQVTVGWPHYIQMSLFVIFICIVF